MQNVLFSSVTECDQCLIPPLLQTMHDHGDDDDGGGVVNVLLARKTAKCSF